MTRYGRRGAGNKKKPLPASTWEEMTSSADKNATSEKSSAMENETNTVNDISIPDTETTGIERENKFSEINNGKKEAKKGKKKKAQQEASALGQNLSSDKIAKEEKKGKKRKIQHDASPSELKPNSAEKLVTQPAEKKPKTSSGELNLFAKDLASALEGRGAEEEEEEEKEKMAKADEEKMLKDAVKRLSKSEWRRMKRIEMRQSQKVCYKCRKQGHKFTDCPEVEGGVDICFHCGSGEHKASQCRNPQGRFSHCNCFICGESGHISRDCPNNPNGVYPNGGCCKTCGSIQHFQRDCPEVKKNREPVMCLKTMDKISSIDEDPTIVKTQKTQKDDGPKKKSAPKLVKF